MMSNKTYDTLKLVALLVAPVVVFLTALINTWGIPHGDQIIATLAALDVLIGAVVKIVATQYHKTQNETEE